MRKQYTRTEPVVACAHGGTPHPPATDCPPRQAESRRRFLLLGAASAVATAVAGPGSAFGSLPPRRAQAPSPAASGAHAYFKALRDHKRFVRGYSFRDQGQIDSITKRGVSAYVTYDPAGDDYHSPHDAAKIVIPSGRASLQRPFPDVPIGVSVGSVLITWDHLWGREYLDALGDGRPHKFNHKQWVVALPNERRFFEVKAFYERTDGSGAFPLGARSYGRLPPDYRMVNGTLAPAVTEFWATPDRWLRYWVLVEDIGETAPRCSLWCADEEHDAALLYERVPIANRLATTMTSLRCQFNSSQRRSGGPDLVSYLRNVAVLRDVAFDGVKGLLARPTAEG